MRSLLSAFLLILVASGAQADHRRTLDAGPSASIDGSGHNLADPEMNAAGSELGRLMAAAYEDDDSGMAGTQRPSPREVSNAVHATSGDRFAARRATDMLWQWGQFVDHDIDLTGGADPEELAPIAVPAGDAWFDPSGSGEVTMDFGRSLYSEASSPRQQVNEISGWIDASNVYGSDPERAAALRANDGTGRLRTSAGNLLPRNDLGLPNAGGSGDDLFLAGDVRANEQLALTAMHTLFMREHNRLADLIRRVRPRWDGDRVYEFARRLVAAEIQVITYEEFLPALLGTRALPRYRGYRPQVDARLGNEFSTGAFRLGHSLLSPTLLRLDASGHEIPEGHLPLRNAFFAPWRMTAEGGIAPLLRGLVSQRCQRLDAELVDDVRNFLFGAPGSGGFDLASLNIQRGRDHGLPSYNDAREALGLGRAASFAHITRDREVQARLASVYADVEQVDLWTGGLSEDKVRGSHLGPLFHSIVVDQFLALRDGDRLWYENSLSSPLARMMRRTRLSNVIRANTEIGREIQRDVFHLPHQRHHRRHR